MDRKILDVLKFVLHMKLNTHTQKYERCNQVLKIQIGNGMSGVLAELIKRDSQKLFEILRHFFETYT
jgi:hypothetical protein